MKNFKLVSIFMLLMFMLGGCTIPDYTGSLDNRPGMLLSGVRPGGPAEMAGIQRGDRIIELVGHEARP